jgi:hypothetical protein
MFSGALGHIDFAAFGLLAINRYATDTDMCDTESGEKFVRVISS